MINFILCKYSILQGKVGLGGQVVMVVDFSPQALHQWTGNPPWLIPILSVKVSRHLPKAWVFTDEFSLMCAQIPPPKHEKSGNHDIAESDVKYH